MKIKFLFLLLFMAPWLLSCGGNDFHIIHLSDVHGHYYPYDYRKDKPGSPSLANVFTFVDSLRDAGEKVLIFDTGDLLQGTPMAYYFNNVDTTEINPAAIAYNLMGLSAMVIGNHDIEQGAHIYRKFFRELKAPVLSANALTENNKPAFKPFKIISLDRNSRIALLGLTTPAIPLWITPDHYPGIHWQGIIKNTKPYLEELKQKSTFMIAGIHAGIDSLSQASAAKSYGLPLENNVLGFADHYPDFDLILCGHEHQIIPGKYHRNTSGNVPLSMPFHSAIVFNHILVSNNQVKSIEVLRSSWFAPHPEMLDKLKAYHQKTLAYINTPLYTLAKKLDMHSAYFYDNALLDFIQKVQLKESRADVSFASCFTPLAALDSGTVRLKDIFIIYKYENYLNGIILTGNQIKKYLEYSAKFFADPNSAELFNDKIIGYNYDVAENMEYSIDLSRPVGQRVRITKIAGKKFSSKRKYKVAINSYRRNGGGGFMTAMGINSPEVYYKSDMEIRNILISALEKGEKISLTANKNFKIIGNNNYKSKVKTWLQNINPK